MTEFKVNDLVYIHESYGPLPKDLFAIVTKVRHRLPAFDDRYPPINIELLVFKQYDKLASWYMPKQLTLLERDCHWGGAAYNILWNKLTTPRGGPRARGEA